VLAKPSAVAVIFRSQSSTRREVPMAKKKSKKKGGKKKGKKK